MKKITSDYQGIILYTLMEKSPRDVEEISKWILEKKLIVKPNDLKPNNRTRAGEPAILQRIRNHLRTERPLMQKGLVRKKDGKYGITSKGKQHFQSTYEPIVAPKLAVAKPAAASLKTDAAEIRKLLPEWYAANIRQIILEGPPGTGKTRLARKIIEEGLLINGDFPMDFQQELNRYLTVVQFHPSYSYEDFVEGLRPTQNLKNELVFMIKRGPFHMAAACALNSAALGRITKDNRLCFYSHDVSHLVGLDSTQVELVSLQKGSITQRKVGVQFNTDGSESWINLDSAIDYSACDNVVRLADPLCRVDSSKANTVDAKDPDFEFFENYESDKRDIWLLNSLSQVVGSGVIDLKSREISNLNVFTLVADNEWLFVQPRELHYFIIDEINRANAAEVFGELLVQLEYRFGGENGLSTKLPYSGQQLVVPENLFVIGTMNNADRSLLKLDRALMRRFHSVNVAPDPNVVGDLDISGVNLGKLLSQLNLVLESAFGSDLAFRVGHAYFTKLRTIQSIDELKRIWYFEIFPLVFDYCEQDIDLAMKLQLFPGLTKRACNTTAYTSVKNADFVEFLKGLLTSRPPGATREIAS